MRGSRKGSKDTSPDTASVSVSASHAGEGSSARSGGGESNFSSECPAINSIYPDESAWIPSSAVLAAFLPVQSLGEHVRLVSYRLTGVPQVRKLKARLREMLGYVRFCLQLCTLGEPQ